jgi:hypothetical protein
LGGVGEVTCWTGGTETGTIGVVTDESGVTVLAVVDVVLTGCSELSERARLASVGWFVVVRSSRALFTGGGAGQGMTAVRTGCTIVTGSD